MINYMKKCEQSMMVTSIVTLILGIILIVNPLGSIKLITGIIAFVFCIIGVFQIFEYIKMSKQEKISSVSFIIGIISIVIGLYLFYNNSTLIKLITIILGISIGVKGLFKIQFALNLKGISDKWTYNLIVGILSSAIGLLLIANPFGSAKLFLQIIGGVFIAMSIGELIETGIVMSSISDVKELDFIEKSKQPKEDKKEEEKEEKKDKKHKHHKDKVEDEEVTATKK